MDKNKSPLLLSILALCIAIGLINILSNVDYTYHYFRWHNGTSFAEPYDRIQLTDGFFFPIETKENDVYSVAHKRFKPATISLRFTDEDWRTLIEERDTGGMISPMEAQSDCSLYNVDIENDKFFIIYISSVSVLLTFSDEDFVTEWQLLCSITTQGK